jgi:hypothetical protein
MEKLVAKGELLGFNPCLFNALELKEIKLENRWFAKDVLIDFESNWLTLSMTWEIYKYTVTAKKIKDGHYTGPISIKGIKGKSGNVFLWVYANDDGCIITGDWEQDNYERGEIWGKFKWEK